MNLPLWMSWKTSSKERWWICSTGACFFRLPKLWRIKVGSFFACYKGSYVKEILCRIDGGDVLSSMTNWSFALFPLLPVVLMPRALLDMKQVPNVPWVIFYPKFCLFVFWVLFLLFGFGFETGFLRTCSVNQDSLELRHPPACASCGLGLKMCTTTTQLKLFF